MRTRTLLLPAISLTVATVAAGTVGPRGDHAEPRDLMGADLARSVVERPVTGVRRASSVLRGWDRRRATAWSQDDASGLAALYVPGSRTGRRDVRDLRRWRSRGLRVVGLRQQVAHVGVEVETARVLVLTVTDRSVDAVAVGHRRRTPLPTSAWARHRVRLRRVHGRWRVDEVVAQPAR